MSKPIELHLNAVATVEALARSLWESVDDAETMIDLILAIDSVIEDDDFTEVVISRLQFVVAQSQAEEQADGVGTRQH